MTFPKVPVPLSLRFKVPLKKPSSRALVTVWRQEANGLLSQQGNDQDICLELMSFQNLTHHFSSITVCLLPMGTTLPQCLCIVPTMFATLLGAEGGLEKMKTHPCCQRSECGRQN